MAPSPVFLPEESHRQESGGLQSTGLQRIKHDWSDLACIESGKIQPSFPSFSFAVCLLVFLQLVVDFFVCLFGLRRGFSDTRGRITCHVEVTAYLQCVGSPLLTPSFCGLYDHLNHRFTIPERACRRVLLGPLLGVSKAAEVSPGSRSSSDPSS